MENPIKMDDLGTPLFLETPISTRSKLTTHSQPYSNSLWIWPSMIPHFAWIKKWTNPSSPVESPFFKRVSSITTLDFQDTVGFFHGFWISCSQRCLGFGWEMIGKNQTCLKRPAMCDGNYTQIHQKQINVKCSSLEKTNGRLSKSPGWPLVSLLCTPRKKNTVAWKLLLSCRVQILGIWAQVLGAKRPKIRLPLRAFLVGGWANPFQNYARQIRSFPPRDPGENTKYLKPAPSFFWRHLC